MTNSQIPNRLTTKGMPDALSKTIPIWCAVLNAALFPDTPASHALHTPPNVVSPTEHSQITALLPSLLTSLQALNLDLPSLRAKLSKPLRPFWVTPDTQLGPPSERETIFEGYRPVVCCTASSKSSSELSSFEGYVQGAADDTEHWAMGLTAPVFWAHSDLLLSTPEADLPALIAKLLEEEKGKGGGRGRVRVARGIYVCALPLGEPGEGECQVVFLENAVTPREEWVKSPRRMEIGLGNPKQTSKNLRSALPAISAFAERHFGLQPPPTPAHPEENQQPPQNTQDTRDPESKAGEPQTIGQDPQNREDRGIVIACTTGKDLSMATALALHCRLLTPDEELLAAPPEDASLNKAAIRQRLGRMMIAFPEANPQRAMLQSVNSFLMG